MSRYIDPTTDFGFKKLFGEESNKDLLMSFLEDVLELEKPLQSVTLLDKEQLPDTSIKRIGVYDVFCEDKDGNRFIVEMQKDKMIFIKDRMIYYSTFPISDQAQKGKKPLIKNGKEIFKIWDYKLMPVYCIAVLGFSTGEDDVCIKRARLRRDDEPHKVFFDKLRYITIELPLFDETKPEYSLDKHLNKWLYYLKNLPSLNHIPDIFKNDIVLNKAFGIAEFANLSPKERQLYEETVKDERDKYSELEAALEEGEKKGKIEVAKMMLKENIPISLIVKMTNLTEDEIKKLKE